jgi:hypothetical protein
MDLSILNVQHISCEAKLLFLANDASVLGAETKGKIQAIKLFGKDPVITYYTKDT